MHTPDNWVVIKFTPSTGLPYYRVLCGWSGGYLDGSSWRMNSGISYVNKDGDFFYFYGTSGSCYRCHQHSYGLRSNNAYVWAELQEVYQDKVCIMDEGTDWVTVFQEENKND